MKLQAYMRWYLKSKQLQDYENKIVYVKPLNQKQRQKYEDLSVFVVAFELKTAGEV